MRILPSLSPRSFWSSSARSRSSCSSSLRWIRSSPRRMRKLEYLLFHDAVESDAVELGVEKLALYTLHENLLRDSGFVLTRPVDQRDAEDDLFAGRHFIKRSRSG